jgi:ribonuclease G
MDNQIVIHATDKQKRIALIENGELAQFFIESPENRRSVGDIYLAQVHKVMGGIRAAFIDLSTPKDAFLHYSDLGEHLEEYLVMLNGRDAIPKKASTDLHEFRKKVSDNQVQGMSNKEQTVQEQNLLGNLLKPGQKIMVQIVKEPIGSKGPRVSTDITLAGRFLVLIPFGDYVAVSKRIRSYKERRRLRGVINSMLPNGFGVIVRTVAEGQKDEALLEDLKEMHDKWIKINETLAESKPTALLHRDLDMTESLVRDLFSKNYNRILIDDPNSFKVIKTYISRIAPSMVNNVVQHKGREHIFDHMKISKDIDSIFSPRVKMPSGGYLIFEQTEAMYVVDVNSGRYAAKKEQEDNSLKTNLEAAREIAKQLRLRDIGGIIVVDFIDLQDDSNRKKIYDEIKKEFKKDRAKTNILPMSDFGLMQITRQRIRPSVVKSVSKVCLMCGGSGSIVSENTLLSDVQSWLQKFRHEYKTRSIDLYVNPHFHSILCQGFFSQRIKWIFKFKMYINIHPDETISLNDYKVTLRNSEVDISTAVMEGKSLEDALAENERLIAEMESEGKRDPRNLDIYKKEDRRSNGKRDNDRKTPSSRGSKSSNSYSDEEDDSDDQNSRSRKPNARITTNNRGRDKVKSKYYKSNEPEEQEQAEPPKPAPKAKEELPPAEKKPDALEVAKAYAKKKQDQLESEAKANGTTVAEKSEPVKEVTEDAKTESKTEQTVVKDNQQNETDSDSKNQETSKKAVKAPVKVKKASKAPRKKTKAVAETQAEETTASKEEATKKESTISEAKAKSLEKFDEAKASLSEAQYRKPADAPVSESDSVGFKKSTVKKRAPQPAKKKVSPKKNDEAETTTQSKSDAKEARQEESNSGSEKSTKNEKQESET